MSILNIAAWSVIAILQWENRGDLAQAIRNEIDRRITDVLATMLRHRNSSGGDEHGG